MLSFFPKRDIPVYKFHFGFRLCRSAVDLLLRNAKLGRTLNIYTLIELNVITNNEPIIISIQLNGIKFDSHLK